MLGIVFTLGLLSAAFGQPAPGEFELESNANAITNHAGSGAPDDWDRLNPLRPGFTPPNPGPSHAELNVFVLDGLDSSIFSTGGSKDVNDINTIAGADTTHNWMWVNGSVPDKDNITNAYAAIYTVADTQFLFFGADRYANNGDANIGFWFFKNKVSLNTDGTFNGVHTVGDILLLSTFTQGGGISTIQLYRWVGPPDPDNLQEILPLPLSQAFAAVCSTDQTSPWAFISKFGPANVFQHGEFYEGGVNLTTLLGSGICFSSFLSETRSSQSLDAQLKDFALHTFPTIPDVSVNDDTVCIGNAGHLCATVTGGLPPFTYSWSGPGGFSDTSHCINPTVAGTYTVTVTGQNCSGQGSGTLTVSPQPVCNITGDDSICTGFTTSFCATAGMSSYAWTGPGFSGSSQCTGAIDSAGVYTVIITDANGCADTCSKTLNIKTCLREFCTYTMGGWGSGCPDSQKGDSLSTQPGCIRDHYFSQVFPNGVKIGDPTGPNGAPWYTAFWQTSKAVEDYLPAGKTPKVLTHDYTNPVETSAGVLAGQILALRLNREYSCAGIFALLGHPGTCYGSFEIPVSCGKFAGISVDSFLVIADIVVGAKPGYLGVLNLFGAKVSDVADAATCMNELFDECDPFAPPKIVIVNGNLPSLNKEPISTALPEEFSVSQNYPNPFNPFTQINYALPTDCRVTLSIYNILGQKVRVLVDEDQSAGYKSVNWDGKDGQGRGLATGIYFYRIQAGTFTQTHKMVLIK